MKAEVSIPVALATMAVVYGVYDHVMPSVSDVKATAPGSGILAGGERTALVSSVAVAGAISLVAKDATPFIFGGLFAVALSWVHRHANYYDPSTGAVMGSANPALDGRRYQVEAVG